MRLCAGYPRYTAARDSAIRTFQRAIQDRAERTVQFRQVRRAAEELVLAKYAAIAVLPRGPKMLRTLGREVSEMRSKQRVMSLSICDFTAAVCKIPLET